MTNLKSKINDFRGELYQGREYVGHIFKVEDGYKVYQVSDGQGTELFAGRVFKADEFRSAGSLNLSASRSVKKYELAA